MLFPLRSFPSLIPKARQRSKINFRWFAGSGSEIPCRKAGRRRVIRPQLSTCANCQPLPDIFVYTSHPTRACTVRRASPVCSSSASLSRVNTRALRSDSHPGASTFTDTAPAVPVGEMVRSLLYPSIIRHILLDRLLNYLIFSINWITSWNKCYKCVVSYPTTANDGMSHDCKACTLLNIGLVNERRV